MARLIGSPFTPTENVQGSHFMAIIVALIAALFHFYDGWLVFSNKTNFDFRLYVYIILAILGWFALGARQDSRANAWRAVTISTQQFLISTLIGWPFIEEQLVSWIPGFGQTLFYLIFVVAWLTPLWVIDLMPGIRKWLLFIAAIIILMTLLTWAAEQMTWIDAAGIFAGDTIRNGPELVTKQTKVIWEKLKNVYAGVAEKAKYSWQNSIDYATGGYYTTILENQENDPVGLYIQRLHTANDRHFQDEPIYLWAEFKGFSFKEDIIVTTRCVTNNPFGAKDVVGVTDPPSFKLFFQSYETVECLFPDGLEPGVHNVEFVAGFDFETLGVVKYNFVHQQTLRNSLRGDEDINKVLDIPYTTTPISTPGPVTMLMASEILQPIPVTQEKGVSAPLGMILQNYWTRGDLTKVFNYVVMIPDIFVLNKCGPIEPMYEGITYGYYGGDYLCEQRKTENEKACATNVKSYLFENIADKHAPQRFQKFSCRLGLEPEDNGKYDPSKVVPLGQQKAEYSFVIQANYRYDLKARLPLTILKYQWIDPIRGDELDE